MTCKLVYFLLQSQLRAAKASINAILEKARREAIQKWITHLQDLQIQAIKTAGRRAAVVKRKIAEKAPKITRKFKEGDYVIIFKQCGYVLTAKSYRGGHEKTCDPRFWWSAE